MERKINLDDYAVLMEIGPVKNDKQEYWITYGGHAHCQPRTGLPAGTFGRRRGKNFIKAKAASR